MHSTMTISEFWRYIYIYIGLYIIYEEFLVSGRGLACQQEISIGSSQNSAHSLLDHDG